MKQPKIRVEVPEKYMQGYYNSKAKRQKRIHSDFTTLLKANKVKYDVTRGMMFFNTEDEAAIFKLTHL